MATFDKASVESVASKLNLERDGVKVELTVVEDGGRLGVAADRPLLHKHARQIRKVLSAAGFSMRSGRIFWVAAAGVSVEAI